MNDEQLQTMLEGLTLDKLHRLVTYALAEYDRRDPRKQMPTNINLSVVIPEKPKSKAIVCPDCGKTTTPKDPLQTKCWQCLRKGK